MVNGVPHLVRSFLCCPSTVHAITKHTSLQRAKACGTMIVVSRSFLIWTAILFTTANLANTRCQAFYVISNNHFGKSSTTICTKCQLRPIEKNRYRSSTTRTMRWKSLTLLLANGVHESSETPLASLIKDPNEQRQQQPNGSDENSETQLVVLTSDPNEQQQQEQDGFSSKTMNTILVALTVGALTGVCVSLFKLSIDEVRKFAYSLDLVQFHATAFQAAFIPALGGIIVSLLALSGEFSPGLRGQVAELDAEFLSRRREVKSPFRYLRKTIAAIATLGTGCSLGPEGPAVEVGMSTTRVILGSKMLKEKNIFSRKEQRLLLACGAAAGVSAGFDAPISAVFFVLEIVQAAFIAESIAAGSSQEGANLSSRETIQSVLLASVMSAGVARQLLKDHLTLTLSSYSLANPFLELPLYLMLGILCGITAFVFSQLAKVVKDAFEGDGPIGQIPPFYRPAVGGLVSGVVGLWFPQILFFGYETLNALLRNNSIPTGTMLQLLVVKTFTTAVAAGSGLVGGTFAPSLFLGGMLGASFHNIAQGILNNMNIALDSTFFVIADQPAYAMVGGASVLAALFRAPLTGSLLVFELSHDYDVILPLMASAGAASLVADFVETSFHAREDRKSMNSVSWGDLATEVDNVAEKKNPQKMHE